MPEFLNACSGWEMTHINLEAILVVEGGIMSNDETFHELTEWWNHTTHGLSKNGGTWTKEIIYMESIESVANKSNCSCEELKKAVGCMVQSCDWS